MEEDNFIHFQEKEKEKVVSSLVPKPLYQTGLISLCYIS